MPHVSHNSFLTRTTGTSGRVTTARQKAKQRLARDLRFETLVMARATGMEVVNGKPFLRASSGQSLLGVPTLLFRPARKI
jgi:hypothetical protein